MHEEEGYNEEKNIVLVSSSFSKCFETTKNIDIMDERNLFSIDE